jgi:hypothetical protein
VLKILYAVGTTILPSEYYTHLVVAVVGITVYTFAQGCKTSRERDLHGRTILITAAFYFNVNVSHFLADATLFSGSIHSEWVNPVKLPSPAWRIRHSPHLRSEY